MTTGFPPLLWRRFPERYTLAGNKCETCGTSYFPARKVCPNCRRRGKLVDESMPRKGKIVSWTQCFVGPTGFEHETPYFVAIIELENKVRLLAQLVDSDEKKVKTGACVEKVFRKINDADKSGPIAYGYKFKIVG